LFLFPGQSYTSSGTLTPTPPRAPLAPPPLPPQTTTSTSGSTGSSASSIGPDNFVKLIVTSGSGRTWTEDNDNNMPSLSKELQDVDKPSKDRLNWRIFEARILIGAKALNIDQYLTSEQTNP
jgi:hypothetical protein